MPSNENCFSHTDSVRNLQLLEERDLGFLISRGVARQVPPSNGHPYPIESLRYCRVYEVYLKGTVAPEFAKHKIELRIWYDLCANQATLRMKERDFDRLHEKLFSKEVVVRFGWPSEWKVPAKVEARR
jgi:hypothetical protein